MTESIRILRSWGTASWHCCGQPAQSRSLLQRCAECPKAGTPVGTRGAAKHHPAAAAGCPDHGALPPGPDAPPCHGCSTGYTADTVPALPPYLHLLGARRETLPLLKHASLPLSHSLAKLEKENDACARMAAAQAGASDFGALCRRVPGPMGGVYRQKIIFLTN
mgnify:CR=1 FL=1